MEKINKIPLEPKQRRVGLIYDERMCGHKNPKGYHPENPNRIRAVWEKLSESGVAERCVFLSAKEAEDDELALVHSKEHIDLIKTISSRDFKTRSKSAKKFDSIYFNKGSSKAAYLAAGSVIEAAEKVAKGELDSAFAIVRPPGHHAEEDEPMGFCLYNNVAIAASFLLNERPELGIRKILIVDWDVHHGNSTQKIFYQDPRVLFFSVHRHDSGNFYPYSNDGSHNMIGEGTGAGYNINVPWENGMCGDADYFSVLDHILIPVAEEFDPDMIIISAGFDAVLGDPIGGCCVSPNGYSIMLDKLMDFARGKVVMALEGGYNSSQLANSAQACIEVLLEKKPLIRSLVDRPLESTWPVIQAVRQALCVYWPVLAAELPDQVINSPSSQIGVGIGVGHVPEEAHSHNASLQANTKFPDISFEPYHKIGRKDDLESAQACENAYQQQDSAEASPTGSHGDVFPTVAHRKRARAGPSYTSPCRKVRKSLFSYGMNPLEEVDESFQNTAEVSLSGGKKRVDDIKRSITRSTEEFEAQLNRVLFSLEEVDESFQNTTEISLSGKMKREDDIKHSIMRSTEEFEAQLNRALTEMEMLFFTVYVNGVQHEVRATLSEAAEKSSREEVAYLWKKNKQLKAARYRAEKALDHEITTGEKFLKSEFGKALLKKAKNDAVSELKSEISPNITNAFHLLNKMVVIMPEDSVIGRSRDNF